MNEQVSTLISAAAIMFAVIGGLALLAHYYTLNGIKRRTVGDGQHGTARFSTKREIKSIYQRIPFRPELWRKGEQLPDTAQQGLILGSEGKKNALTALVDTDDVHCLMIGASGVGKGQECWPAVNTIAKDMNLSRSTVKGSPRSHRCRSD